MYLNDLLSEIYSEPVICDAEQCYFCVSCSNNVQLCCSNWLYLLCFQNEDALMCCDDSESLYAPVCHLLHSVYLWWRS